MRLASLLESKRSKKLAGVLIRRRKPLGLLLYVCGLVYLCLLSRDELNHRSFIDENALMVGLVKREFGDLQSISDYAKELAGFHGNQDGLMVRLEGELARIGLEVYRQNFSAVRPAVSRGQQVFVSGQNTYGILRAGRSPSAESLVFSAPVGADDNTHGLAMMLSLAQYFKSKNYWAKDIVFLVTSGDEIGPQAWISSYMGDATTGIAADPLSGRSGAIQAVINLQINSPKIEYATLLIEGVNGLLPNLDLIHVLTHLSEMEGLPSALHVAWEGVRSRGRHTTPNYDDSTHKLLTVASLMAHQAPGLPLASHAPFLRHRIDSLTVQGVGSGPKAKPLISLARALEGCFRSLNNLLERLHHSEFSYYTPSRGRFISIGLFMPPLGLLLAPIVLEGLAQWLLARGFRAVSGSSYEQQVPPPLFPFHAVLGLILPSLLSGVLLLCLPRLAAMFLSPLVPEVLAAALGWGCLLSVFLPLFSTSSVSESSWNMAKCFSLIFQLLLLVTIAMTNYALSIVLILFLPLPSMFSQPSRDRGARWLHHRMSQLLILLLAPPLAIVSLCSLYCAVFVSETPSFDLETALVGGVGVAGRGLVLAYNSWYFVEAWLFPVGCLGVWPVWLMGWRLTCQQVREEEAQKIDKSSSHPHSD